MKKRGKHSNKNTDISKKRKKEDEKWVPKAFLKNDCKTNNTTDNTLYDSDDYENDSIDNTLDTQEFKQKKINKKKKTYNFKTIYICYFTVNNYLFINIRL